MKILHIADLHLGKKTFGYSLLEDQRYFLDKTVDYLKDNQINKLIIAGDIYDTASPSGDAISLFDSFLTKLVNNKIEAFIISGNHDSKDRVGYLNNIVASQGIHINSSIENALKPITSDNINFYLIPYSSASDINAAFETNYKNYNDALAYVINKMEINKEMTNIAIAHQLVLPTQSELEFGGSEEPVVGTISNIPSSLFSDFDYVALGHIHKPQNVAKNARYSGSPLAYHSDEAKYEKSYTIIEVNGKNLSIKTDKIIPLRDTKVLTGTFEDILTKNDAYKSCYIHAVITDGDIPNAMEKLKQVFPYALSISYLRHEGVGVNISEKIKDIENISPNDLFSKLYTEQMGLELTDYQKEIINDLLKDGDE